MQSKIVIGILTKAPKSKKNSSKTTFITASYCDWLESCGAKVVPIPYNLPLSIIEEILPQLNGLLIQGGRCRIKWPYKEGRIQKVLKKHNHLPIEIVLEHILNILLKNKTVKTPIFLICWGMELFPLILTGKARDDILKKSTDCRRVFLPSHKIVKDSQLFRYFTEEELEIMEKEKVTYHNHANNVIPEFFEENEILKRDCIVTSRGFDGSGMEFVSSFENREFPLIAVQHHPEKIGTILHDVSEQCLKINRKFGEVFVSLCKENQNILLDEKWLLNEKLDANPFYSARRDVIEGVNFYCFTLKNENCATPTTPVTMNKNTLILMKYQYFDDEVVLKKSFRTIEGVSSQKGKKTPKKSQIVFSSYGRLVGYPCRHPIHFAAAIIFAFMSHIGEVVLPFISGKVMDALYDGNYDDFHSNCYLYMAGLLVSSLSIVFRTTLVISISDLVSNLLKNEAFEKFIKNDMEFYEDHKTGELLSRIDSDIATLRWAIGAHLTKLMKGCFILFGSIGFMLFLDWELTIILLVIIPLMVGISSIFSKYVKEYSKNYQQMIANSTIVAEECFMNIKTIKSFVQEENESGHFRKILRDAYSIAKKKALLSAIYQSATSAITYISMLAILWIGGSRVIEGDISYGTIVAFMLYSRAYSRNIRDFSEAYTSIVVASGIAEVLFELFDYKPKILEFNSDGISTKIEGAIEFRNVSFIYPKNPEVYIFKNFNLNVRIGERIAFCGASGGGKTTIVQILQKFYNIQEGDVLIDGIDIKKYDIKHLRRKIGLVSQEPSLFSGTIEQNITFGVNEYTKKELLHAAEIANALNFIQDKEKFPQGFETLVGEKGLRLSGGQKQRIAIARALIKKPKILILDESTSALDAESEHSVIIIAHRLSTIVNCSRILVFSDGKIIEEGTHETLFRKEGTYFNLMQKQIITH